MKKIKVYVEELLLEGKSPDQIADILGVGTSMVSQYKHGYYNPSLSSAIKVYANSKLTLYPFAEKALQEELDENNK